ncbi:transposable element Tcb2 transposase [Trichonephila clavipes]|nr:transposable element Tcb2 transposase [Trichonephila clavipes]
MWKDARDPRQKLVAQNAKYLQVRLIGVNVLSISLIARNFESQISDENDTCEPALHSPYFPTTLVAAVAWRSWSWTRGWSEICSNLVPLNTRRVEELSRFKVLPLACCGRSEREVLAQVSSSLLDHSSKLRDPSPKILRLSYSAKSIKVHSIHTTPLRRLSEAVQAIGVSQSVISRIWNCFLETESAGRRSGQGHRWATTPNQDRFIVLMAQRQRNMNATLLQQHLRSATGISVSTQTVRNRLHGIGLYARRQLVCVKLTLRHRRDRREWATEHVNWRRNEWSNVLFSDESHFSVHPDNRRIFIWRDRGIRNNPAFVHESVRFCGGGVLVYGGISIDGRTDLYIIRDGPMTARRYRDEILRPVLVPYAAAIGDDFILMDDNCRPHRANLVGDFLFEEGIVRMEWPACSSDMNPIEHVWDA